MTAECSEKARSKLSVFPCKRLIDVALDLSYSILDGHNTEENKELPDCTKCVQQLSN